MCVCVCVCVCVCLTVCEATDDERPFLFLRSLLNPSALVFMNGLCWCMYTHFDGH